MSRDDLLGLLSHDNLQAFLHVIREGESSNDDSGYTVLNGGEHFQAPPWEHPNRVGRGGKSTAAGAYQTIAKTWASLVTQYGFVDFSPINQDCAAAALIVQHGAMDPVLAGRPLEAIRRINSKWIEWECFERKDFLAQVPAIFASYGGKQVDSPVPVPTQITQEVKPMGALLPLILQMIPSLISVFGSPNDSEVAKRNQAAGVLVADTLVKVTQANNLADAVGKMQSDPAVLQAATDAVHELLPQLLDVGGGVESARKFAADHENSRYGRILEVVSYCAMFFLLLANVMSAVAAYLLQDASVMADVKQADIGAALIAFGYFLGSSISSKRKDEIKGVQ